MTENVSAKIYRFPTGGRAGVVGCRDAAWPAGGFPASEMVEAALGGAWYHEQAVREDERARNTVRRFPKG